MLWYALSRDLWMCRSIIAILSLTGHFSLPHLAQSHPLDMLNVAICLCCPFLGGNGHWKNFYSALLSFLFRFRIGRPSLRPHLCPQKKKKLWKSFVYALNCCRSTAERNHMTPLNIDSSARSWVRVACGKLTESHWRDWCVPLQIFH